MTKATTNQTETRYCRLPFFPATLALLGALWCTASAMAENETPQPVFELRTYTTHEGKLDALHTRFRDHTVALFKKHGMTNIAYWIPEDKPNTLVYLLAHPSVEARGESFKAFGADPDWKKAFAESRKDGPLVAKVDSVMLTPTDYSPAKTAAEIEKVDAGLLYELRTYTTEEGKLDNLNARFRDHTMKLFKRHGITNVVYFTPLEGERSKNTLVYLIAHKNRAAADASWDEFRQDPEWKKVAEESQKDGRILIQGGVQREFLTLTDYSPKK